MKALVGAFNQERALVGAFSVIVKSSQTFVSSSSPQTRYDVRCDTTGLQEAPSKALHHAMNRSYQLWWQPTSDTVTTSHGQIQSAARGEDEAITLPQYSQAAGDRPHMEPGLLLLLSVWHQSAPAKTLRWIDIKKKKFLMSWWKIYWRCVLHKTKTFATN